MFDAEYLFKDKNFKGVVILLDKNMRMLRINENFVKLQGFTEKELLGKAITDIVVPEDKPIFFDNAYTIELSKEFTIQMYHENGAFRYFSFNMYNLNGYFLLFGESVIKQFAGYDYDTTKREELNKALDNLDVDDISEIYKDSDVGLRNLLSFLSADIWIKDRLGRYVFINAAFSDHTGVSFENAYLKDDFQLFEKDVAQGFLKSDQIAIKSKQRLEFIFESKTEDFLTWTEVTKIPVTNKDGKHIGIIGISTDITELKLVEVALKVKIDNIERILNLKNDFIFEINSALEITNIRGRLATEVGVNKVFEKLNSILFENDVSVEIMEKINLAYSGTDVSFNITCGNEIVKIELFSAMDSDSKKIVCGFGNAISNKGVQNG